MRGWEVTHIRGNFVCRVEGSGLPFFERILASVMMYFVSTGNIIMASKVRSTATGILHVVGVYTGRLVFWSIINNPHH